MIIGIPKEILPEEARVAAIPETVSKYIEMGFAVNVESSAGRGIGVEDNEYANAGANIMPDAKVVFASSDIVLKVKQPYFNEALNLHEADLLPNNSTLITFLHPATPSNHDIIRKLRDKNITSFTMDGIPRISRAQRMDALTSMSMITGYKAILLAADYMPKFIPMYGTAIGTIPPANILVIGTGVVGLQAIATGKRLGGVVKALDIRKEACTQSQSLGARILEFDIPQELAVGAGGYAKALDETWLNKERHLIAPLLREMDIVILSALVPGEVSPILITGDMVGTMKYGSVIMDISIDQGGNCEITTPGQVVQQGGVYICGIQNIPGRVAVHASWLYAHNMYYYIENLCKNGIDKFDLNDEIVNSSLVTNQGKIVHGGTLKAMNQLKQRITI